MFPPSASLSSVPAGLSATNPVTSLNQGLKLSQMGQWPLVAITVEVNRKVKWAGGMAQEERKALASKPDDPGTQKVAVLPRPVSLACTCVLWLANAHKQTNKCNF